VRHRVLRGGSYYYLTVCLRTTFRIRYVPMLRNGLDGFRVVVVRRKL
jgi:formylglycine-generating enzyme required for sulfatase activity